MKIEKKIFFLVLSYLLLICASLLIYQYYKYSNFYIYKKDMKIETWGNALPSCYANKNQAMCENLDKNKLILLIGDSHASQLYFGLNRYKKNDQKIILISSELMNEKNRIDQVNYLKKITGNQINIESVIISFAQHHLIGRSKTAKKTQLYIEDTIKILVADLKKNKITNIILMNDTPRLAINLPMSICKKQYDNLTKTSCDISSSDSRALRKKYGDLINTMGNNLHLKIFDPFKIICPGPICSPFSENNILYIDQNHVSIYGSELIGKELINYANNKQ